MLYIYIPGLKNDPSSSCWIRSLAINERNVCTSSTANETGIFLVVKKGVLIQNSCVWSFASCGYLNLAGLLCLVLQVQWCRQWRFSPANQGWHTSHFGKGTVCLEPQPRWYWKKNQVPSTVPSGTPPPKSEPYRTVPCRKAPLDNIATIIDSTPLDQPLFTFISVYLYKNPRLTTAWDWITHLKIHTN